MGDAAFWDRVARRYAARPVRDLAAYETTVERSAAHLTGAAEVLELGCGTGATALRLAPDAGRLTGCDTSGEMIAIAKERLADAGAQNVAFRCCDVFDPAFAPGQFDAVLAFNLLHLLEDMPATLERVRGLLRPGGVLISKTICIGRGALHFRLLLGGLRLAGLAPGGFHFLTPAELETRIVAAEFEIVETGTYPARPPARFIVARRP
jgi:SAM-dependent methyltransferase